MADLSVTRSGDLHTSNLTEIERLRRAAAQFETYFLKELLKHGRQEQNGGLFQDSPAMKQFRDLLDNGLAERSAGDLGIADMLVKDLAARAGIAKQEDRP